VPPAWVVQPGHCLSAAERPWAYMLEETAMLVVECVIAALSKIPRGSGDRVKTDRRDAEHLVRLLMAGKLRAVRVPGAEEEALRDLVRARESVRIDLMRPASPIKAAAQARASVR